MWGYNLERHASVSYYKLAFNLRLHAHYPSPSDGGVGGPVLLQQNAIFPQMMPKCLLVTMRPHCKYISCNFYSLLLCPNFQCNLTLQFTFNCCSDYGWIIVKLKNSFFYCNFYIGLYKAIKCKLHSKITVESGHNGKTVHIYSV